LQQRLANAPTPRAADALRKNFANLQDEMLTKASLFEGDGHRSIATANIGSNLDQMATIPLRDPSQAAQVYGDGLGIIHGGLAAGLAQGDLDKMGETWLHRVYGAAAQHDLDNNPQQLANALRAGQYDKVLSEPQLVEFQGNADAAVRRQQAEARQQANENALMARGSVESRYADNLASIRDTGKPAVPLSAAEIAAAFPREPYRAQGMVNSMNQAQLGYTATKQVALNGPTDDQALLGKLTPSGPGYADQAQTYSAVQSAIEQKHKAISQDPAGYVQAASPQVSALFQAANDGDPKKFFAAVSAQDAAYEKLGVPENMRTVLPAPAAAAVVSKLANADPTKVNAGATLDQMQQSYGPAWPRVYADLVHAKLPASYEVLATMDTPQQAAGRQDMQRALVTAAQKGGPKALEEMAPPDASQAIKDGLPDALASFQQSVTIPGAVSNVSLLGKVRDAVSTLAHYYAIQGQPGATALTNAYDAVIGDKYDFDGTMRVPKQVTLSDGRTVPLTLGQAHAATSQAMASIQPADLSASAGLPPGIASDRWASAQQRSAWYPTETDDGLMLMVQARDGRWSRVLRNDGGPVQVKFQDMAQPNVASPANALPTTAASSPSPAGAPPAPGAAPASPAATGAASSSGVPAATGAPAESATMPAATPDTSAAPAANVSPLNDLGNR
jgi:hypothetical protein